MNVTHGGGSLKLFTKCTDQGAGQGQLPLVPCLWPPGMSCKAIYRGLILVLGLEVPRRCQAVGQGQLPLALGLRVLSKRYEASWGQMLLV